MSFDTHEREHRGGQPRKKRPRVFASVDHLNPEVVAAFVDGELCEVALHRARVHLVHCGECRGEVHRQRLAAEALHEANWTADVRPPRELLGRLHDIAKGACAPGPGAEAVPTPQPETVLDKLEVFMRTMRKNTGLR
ncbi:MULTISPECIES: hypothetical protein [unclassified Corynebacterium]|uniref:hypothetical protein n=1 Tax=unclassified Corynebacterium TaxID=2624378 RepID=UPI0029CA1249|nr:MULTISPECIES: hypothetical protein [unclassified Corynebacterium]WPF66972.1 hypothetical protein OLX12_04410 [Corynebacterium sp. 22KM0430]WPF69460.1 hypothetical protein OLW90_04405 [Corynebacterium sp. 21KM1197]